MSGCLLTHLLEVRREVLLGALSRTLPTLRRAEVRRPIDVLVDS